jgi:hypothetical protein
VALMAVSGSTAAWTKSRVIGAFGIYRFDRNRLDLDQQIAASGSRVGQDNVLEGFGIIDGQGLLIADGFHEFAPDL